MYIRNLGTLGIVLVIGATALRAAPLGTAFSYQGQLKQDGVPVDGAVNFVFRLFNAGTGGAQVGSNVVRNGVAVVNGLFTVELDFGADAFAGDARWLDVRVNGTLLTPRQAITAGPYALHAASGGSNWLDNGEDVFLPEGNVGIGVDQPTAMLHLQRPLATTALRFQTIRFQEGPPASMLRSAGAAAAAGAGQVWSSPASARLSDDARATASFSAVVGTPDNEVSQSLNLTNFGFTIPPQAMIVGVTAHVEGLGACSCPACDACRINGDVELLGGDQPTTHASFTFDAADSVKVFGGTFHTWGQPWTPAQVNAPAFGVRLTANLAVLTTILCLPPPFGCSHVPCDCAGTGSVGVDAVSLTVYYYDVSVTSTPLDWSLGLSEEDANFRIAPTSDLSTPALVVTPEGRVGIGTTEFNLGAVKFSVNGAAAKPGGGSWAQLSDARLKRGIEPLTGALERMLSLRGVTFEFTEEGLRTGLATPGRHTGFIAQEVEAVFPEWITEPSGGYKLLSEEGTTALLVEALRELRAEKDAEITQRDLRILELEQRLRRVEDLLEQRTRNGGEE